MKSHLCLCAGLFSLTLAGCAAHKKPLIPVPTPPAPAPAPAATTPAPAKPAPTRRLPKKPATSAVKPPTPPPPPAPLSVLLPPATNRQYLRELDQLLTSARATVARASRQPLNPAQRETLERMQSFVSQAAATRDNDPATALQLARRADLLGQDLLRTLPK